MSKAQIRKDIQRLKVQTRLAEPDWKKRAEKLQELLRVQEELRAKLSPEVIRECVQEVVEEYKRRYEEGIIVK